MGQRIQLDKENKAVLLFSKARQKWEDKTTSATAMYSAYYYGNFTGYDIYFKGAEGKFFYKKENVQFLNKTGNIHIEKKDVYSSFGWTGENGCGGYKALYDHWRT